jgi:hypothetical protein
MVISTQVTTRMGYRVQNIVILDIKIGTILLSSNANEVVDLVIAVFNYRYVSAIEN